MTPDEVRAHLKARGVLEEVSAIIKARAVTWAELIGVTRKAHVSAARFEVWHHLREKYKWSYPTIAEVFDRDHPSILRGVRKHEATLQGGGAK